MAEENIEDVLGDLGQPEDMEPLPLPWADVEIHEQEDPVIPPSPALEAYTQVQVPIFDLMMDYQGYPRLSGPGMYRSHLSQRAVSAFKLFLLCLEIYAR